MKVPSYDVLTCVAMKICTHCGKEYPDEATECIIDKRLLSPADLQSVSSSNSKHSTFFTVRRCCAILCGLVIAALCSFSVIAYLGGRLGRPLAILFFPAQIAPALIILCSTIALVVICAITLVKRRNRRFAFSMLALSLIALASGPAVNTGRIFQIGFRHRIQSAISPAELREIARACAKILPVDGSLPGPKKWSLWNETEHRAKWNALVNSTALEKLDASMLLFNRADEVEITWGGALVGHWGVIIQKTEASDGDIAPGIKTFLSP